MSLYQYRPLDTSKNEIRILHFPATNCNGDRPLRCTIQEVSLNALLPAYRLYLQDCKPSTPVSAVRGWLRAHRANQPWPDTGTKSIAVDAWRFSAEYEDSRPVTENGPIASKDYMNIPSRFEWGDFEAVSYCWGPDVRDRVVLVDDKAIPITSNLESMLRELQCLPEARSGMGFWVDGLCINQEDILEKNHQVRLMSRIYSQATSTVVWLGSSTPSSNEAIDELIQSFGDCRVSYVEDGEERWAFHSGAREPSPHQTWSAILNLCSRQYFKRMWIIQELALNKNMTMFICGSRRFSRVYLQGACNLARTNAGSISKTLGISDLLNECDIPIRHDLVWHTANNVYGLIKLRAIHKGLNQLLFSVRKAKATDPRDKVYGMLGLLPQEIATHIQPDYSKATSQVFLELATAILRRCERLDELLSWCSFNEESTLPSWVPDWQFTHERRHLRRFRESKAGGSRQSPMWSLERLNLGLRVKAVRIGQVQVSSLPVQSLLPYKVVDGSKTSQTHVPLPFGSYGNRERLSMALERTLMHAHPKRLQGADLTDILWTDRYTEYEQILELAPGVSDQWQYFDRFRQSNANLSIFGVPFRDFFTATNEAAFTLDASNKKPAWKLLLSENASLSQDNDGPDEQINPYAYNLRRAVIALQHRRLCTTETGFVCLAPNEVEIGDTVAIILGCNYPVLLRPYEDGFKYVGECYVDGMMDGEAIEAADRGQYQAEDIVLL